MVPKLLDFVAPPAAAREPTPKAAKTPSHGNNSPPPPRSSNRAPVMLARALGPWVLITWPLQYRPAHGAKEDTEVGHRLPKEHHEPDGSWARLKA